ncbi:MAG TPA: hypothetical protein VFL29_02455 [Candidatus Dormibacteraeota bacterium]|nr:hypothetical protein [Candidatus Dormibacteraeota bacterium]
MVAARPRSEGMLARIFVAVAVAIIAATVALYLTLIRSQGGPPPDDVLTVPFVAGYLSLMAVFLIVSLVVPQGARPALRSGAGCGLLVLGVLSAFSIGVPVLMAGAFSLATAGIAIAARPGARSVVSSIAAGVVAVVVLLGGFQYTWSHIVCPPTGESGGTTASVLGQGTTYECHNGVLTIPTIP